MPVTHHTKGHLIVAALCAMLVATLEDMWDNYNEIFQRNLTPLGLPRGINSLWTEGGLLYAPPFR